MTDDPTNTRRVALPQSDKPQYVEVELDDFSVRCADSVRVSYDFARDGWVIEQAKHFEFRSDDALCDPGWTEVAFCRAFQMAAPGQDVSRGPND